MLTSFISIVSRQSKQLCDNISMLCLQLGSAAPKWAKKKKSHLGTSPVCFDPWTALDSRSKSDWRLTLCTVSHSLTRNTENSQDFWSENWRDKEMLQIPDIHLSKRDQTLVTPFSQVPRHANSPKPPSPDSHCEPWHQLLSSKPSPSPSPPDPALLQSRT